MSAISLNSPLRLAIKQASALTRNTALTWDNDENRYRWINIKSQLVTDAPSLSSIKWDATEKRYLWKRNNKVVSDKQLSKLLSSQTNKYAIRLEKLTRRFTNGQLSFEDWQLQFVDLIKRQNVAMARFSKGGKDKTFANDYLVVGRKLKQIDYFAFQKFAQQIKNGDLSKAQIEYRAKLYANSTRLSFEKTRQSQITPDYQARRKLGNCADHCQCCIDYANLGWVSLSDRLLPVPGEQCDCKMNCCCSIEYRRIKITPFRQKR